MNNNNNRQKKKRAYIGNLRYRPDLPSRLHTELFLPNNLRVTNAQNGGIVVSRTGFNNNAFAFVEFNDVDYAIRTLDGARFDGRTLRVSKEKANIDFRNSGSTGGSVGFGSSRWAGDGGSSNDGQQRRAVQQKRMSEESSSILEDDALTPMNQHDIETNVNQEDTIVAGIKSVITTEFEEKTTNNITTAIMCTAAMTFLASMDAFGLAENDDDDGNDDDERRAVDGADMTSSDFMSRRQMSMSDLLVEYGKQDVDWKRHQPQRQLQGMEEDIVNKLTSDDFSLRCQMPLSDLMAEYGEQSEDWKKERQGHRSVVPATSTVRSTIDDAILTSSQNADEEQHNSNGVLAHYDKAFIHLELMSFGYKYGAPSHARNGFTYTHPLPPFDIRDLDRAPGHISKFNGLQYLVRRSLLNPSKLNDDAEIDYEEEDDDIMKNKERSPMRQRVDDIADEIIKILVESIDEGGHGALSPLTMTISIGSEYGRHRAVVLVEHLAVVLKARLRRNDGNRFGCSGTNGIVRQPVSVGIRHRDLEARHQDEEAFGEDLKREERKLEKAKMRQMRSNGWDDDRW